MVVGRLIRNTKVKWKKIESEVFRQSQQIYEKITRGRGMVFRNLQNPPKREGRNR